VHDDDIVWEQLDGELPLLVPGDDRDDERARGREVLDTRHRAAHLIDVLSERITMFGDDVRGVGVGDPLVAGHARAQSLMTISRYFIAHPEPVADAFDTWFAYEAGDIVTDAGTLELADEPSPPADVQLRLLTARLVLHHTARPVPVQLELVAWGSFRAALHLRPAMRIARPMGRHRRLAYFAGGHACAEVVRDRIEAVLR
jgi:hypothetical protein